MHGVLGHIFPFLTCHIYKSLGTASVSPSSFAVNDTDQLTREQGGGKAAFSPVVSEGKVYAESIVKRWTSK